MRTVILFAACFVMILTEGVQCALGHENKILDQQSIAALEATVSQAEPRYRCFLYAEIVQQMSELSVRQYASGNVAVATRMLKDIQRVVKKVHLSLSKDNKRLKETQILLSKTSFRLTQMLHASDYVYQPLVKETLAQVNRAQREALLQVFQR